MPLVDCDNAATWAALYQLFTPDGARAAHYERAVRDLILGCNGLPFGKGDHFKLAAALELQPGQSIIIIGAGFGWVAEDWIKAGLGPIVCVDRSAWIHANKAGNATLPILNADGADPRQRATILAAIGGMADWCISEDVLPLLDDSEALGLADNMRGLGDRVAHWVSSNCTAPLNPRSMQGWKDLLGDPIVRRGAAEAA